MPFQLLSLRFSCEPIFLHFLNSHKNFSPLFYTFLKNNKYWIFFASFFFVQAIVIFLSSQHLSSLSISGMRAIFYFQELHIENLNRILAIHKTRYILSPIFAHRKINIRLKIIWYDIHHFLCPPNLQTLQVFLFCLLNDSFSTISRQKQGEYLFFTFPINAVYSIKSFKMTISV